MSSKQFWWGMSEQKKLDMPFFWQIPFAASYICARNFSCFCHPHIILTNFLALLTRNTMGKFNKGDFHDSMKIFTYVHYNKGQSSLMRSKKNSTKHGIYIHLFFADTLRSAKYLNNWPTCTISWNHPNFGKSFKLRKLFFLFYSFKYEAVECLFYFFLTSMKYINISNKWMIWNGLESKRPFFGFIEENMDLSHILNFINLLE